MFDVSDKGEICDTRNTKSDIQKYKEKILINNTDIFDFKYNQIVFIKLVEKGIIYGPWVNGQYPVESINNLLDGEIVYMIAEGMFTKMVSKTGVAKNYIGSISDFKAEKWNEYIDVGNNYKVKFYI